MSTLPSRPGFFTRLLLQWSSKRNRRELEAFVGVVAEMPEPDLAELTLCVAMVRRGMEDQGLHPLDPFNLVMFESPDASIAMAAQSEKFAGNGAIIPAAACSVWGHTFRAVLDGNLRPGARLMWRELLRGRSGFEAAANRINIRDGIRVNVDGADAVPTGFEQ